MRAIKKSVSVLLALAMLCSLFMTTAFATDDDGSTATTITSLSQITDMSGDYVLGTNVDIDASEWSPIGTSTNPFTGTFDGNGKTITWSGSATGSAGYGVFGYSSGTVTNVTVSGTLTITGSVNYVSTLVGYNSGTISNVTSTATLSAGDSSYVGAAAGFNTSTVQGVSNSGAVTGYNSVGGIAGGNAGTINSCATTSSGTVTSTRAGKAGVGGIVGRNGDTNTTETGVITNCYNQGTIISVNTTDKNSRGQWVGGICGFQNGLSSCTNCYNTGVLYAYSYADHTAGKNEGTVENCYGLNDSSIGAEDYDGTKLRYEYVMKGYTDFEMSVTDSAKTFLNELKGSTSGVWTQSTGSYPDLVTLGASSALTVTVSLTSLPTKTSYAVGDALDLTGLEITAVYSTGDTVIIPAATDTTEGYTASPANGDALSATDTSVTISGTYTDGDDISVSYSFTIAITVGDSTIYLDGTATENGDGSASNPYNSLSSAVTAAGSGGTVVIIGTVELTGTYYDNVTFLRGDGFSGAMFSVTSGTVTLASSGMVIDGDGGDTLFTVTGGVLQLRGGVTLQNCDTAVEVAGGEVQVNKTTISANSYSVKVSSGTFTLNASSGASINGTVYLADSTSISVGAAIPNALTVECETPSDNLTVAAGGSYSLTSTDASNVTYVKSNAYTVELDETNNQLVLTERDIYLDVTNGNDENGGTTSGAPVKTYAKAVELAGDGGFVVIMKTVTLAAGSYYDSVTFKPYSGLEDAMFEVSTGTVTLAGSSMVLDGESSATLISVSGDGILRLRGGVTLEDCTDAVVVSGGDVQVNKTSITASEYSVKVESGTFTLNDFGNTSISGNIYLASGTYITAGAAIPCAITVNMEASSGYPSVVIGSGYALTLSDLANVTCLQGTVVLDSDSNEIYLNVE